MIARSSEYTVSATFGYAGAECDHDGVTIGKDSVIGAGSVVTKDIPAGVVAVGNPARVIRTIGQ